MSKSGGNAIPLFALPEDILTIVKAMFTNPNHLRVEDLSRVEGNMICTYLDAFDAVQDKLSGSRSSSNGVGVAMARVRRVWKLPFRTL